MKAKTLLALLIYFTAAQSIAWAGAQSIHLKAHGGKVFFADPEQGNWRSVYYSKGNSHHELFPKQRAYFDESLPSDFSKSSRYLKIHKIIRVSIEGDAMGNDCERAYCAFVEMASGCIVRQETGSFCGGQWADTDDQWLWAGEEIVVDQRDPNNMSNSSIVEELVEINGDVNLPLCRPTNP